MPKASWTVGIKPFMGATTYYTSYVLSMNYQFLRRSPLDQFTGNTIKITLNNSTNVAQYFTFGSKVVLNDDLTFTVVGVDFDDYPGNTGLSTCTVTAMDSLASAGRQYVSSASLAATTALGQLSTIWATADSILTVTNASSAASAYTYTGTALQRLQQAVTCEQAAVQQYDDKIVLIGRNSDRGIYFKTTFTRATSSGSNVSYNDIRRIRADLEMANTITVNQDTLSPVTASDSASVALYKTQADSVSSVDSTTSSDLASWLANSRSDPSTQTFEIDVVDTAQTQDAIDRIMLILFNDTGEAKVHTLVYRVPGAVSDTTETVFFEGARMNVTPTQTRFTFYFSPMTYYQLFLLDNSTQGILDTSRLGW